MRIIENKIILLIIAITLIISCGKSNDLDTEIPEPEPDPITVNAPGKPTASLPVNGEPCSDFDAVAGDTNKARIKFSWSSASDATSYVLNVKESETLVVNKEITGTSNYIVLDKGKTYAWTVTAKNSTGETLSTTNSFTTPGKPIGNYVPYAAVIAFTVDNTTDVASLSWTGSDQDAEANDLSFNILVTEDTNELFVLEETTQTSITDFSVLLNSTYQIKVTTIDQYGSYSTSVFNYTHE